MESHDRTKKSSLYSPIKIKKEDNNGQLNKKLIGNSSVEIDKISEDPDEYQLTT